MAHRAHSRCSINVCGLNGKVRGQRKDLDAEKEGCHSRVLGVWTVSQGREARGTRCSPSAYGVATAGCCVGSTRALTLKAGTQVL